MSDVPTPGTAAETAAALGEPEAPDAGAASPLPQGAVAVLHGCPVTDHFGQAAVHTDQARYLALMEALYRDGFEACMGVAGVDYLTHPGRQLPEGVPPERFEVVVELVSISRKERLRVRCQVPAEDPVLPSLFDLWPGSEAHERETFDMFGIRFNDHPDLTRILMPEDWEGHPLRKDYATGHVPVQFKETPK
ncbi:MAG TPA: NADH-quinone oxidoreductase subunit C [Acidimicrobiales bacterium]|nr:NADH-quinone oxidoreductase subunit C [Acidimicrobiales bacterium]